MKSARVTVAILFAAAAAACARPDAPPPVTTSAEVVAQPAPIERPTAAPPSDLEFSFGDAPTEKVKAATPAPSAATMHANQSLPSAKTGLIRAGQPGSPQAGSATPPASAPQPGN
jgi:hypothetical protein